MAGKCRPSLREKTLEIVKHSNLSQTNKDCIAEVFKRYEEAQAEIERLNVYANDLLGLLVGRKMKQDESETLEDIQARDEAVCMTDNDIIKALECCAEPVGINCVKCPLEKDCLEVNMCELSLDLINRQKAEIERLRETIDGFTDIGKLYSEIRAEAITEFAERLKGEVKTDYINGTREHAFAVITKIAKEMKGEQE